MKLLASIVQKIPQISSSLFILLFIYAGVSKLLELEVFQTQLGKSPLLAAYATPLSYGMIATELIAALLLSFEITRLLGFWIGFLLMLLFTTYIIIILNFSSYIPCSCGGVLKELGWTEHLIFNSFFIGLGLMGILFSKSKK